MRFRTLEIRWHDSRPISSCDFQPVPFKKARPPVGQEVNYATQSWRLATGGEDNHVRVWMVHPNIMPVSPGNATGNGGGSTSELHETTSGSGNTKNNNANASQQHLNATTRPPRTEYLCTLSRHSAAVNVVRFSPNGELIASAGDDGMIIIWAPSSSPQPTTYGSDLSPEDLQHEKEYWKPRTAFRCSTMQVYDLAWSPSGEYIIAGSTDNVARIFSSSDGKCLHELAEHNHYVQGVAWDPMNEFIATQSSDRSMHVYDISTKHGSLEVHAVGKNSRMQHQHHQHQSHHHRRTPSSQSRPRMFRSESGTSDVESVVSDLDIIVPGRSNSTSIDYKDSATPLTPATSVASTPAMFPPPPIEKTSSSRRSSFSGSNATGSPSTMSRYGRSPSPMPALPAIRTSTWSSVRLYGDESFTNFFRRLTFSPDGGLLLTPAGQFEDPSVIPAPAKTNAGGAETPTRGRKGNRTTSGGANAAEGTSSSATSSVSSVLIYSRANFARPPIAQLPGHKKASVAVRFSPVLYELRPGVIGPGASEKKANQSAMGTTTTFATGPIEKSKDIVLDVDLLGPTQGALAPLTTITTSTTSASAQMSEPSWSPRTPSLTLPSPAPSAVFSLSSGGPMMPMSPTQLESPMDAMRPPTPIRSKPSTPHPHSTPTHHSHGARSTTPAPNNNNNNNSGAGAGAGNTASVFALPYRMLFAVVTMDSVAIYDTQQAGPLCLLTKLHYDEFTDMCWTPDGQSLLLSSRDGYCTLIVFDEILPAHHTQQHTLQLQSIAHHHSLSLTTTNSSSTGAGIMTPSSSNVSLPMLASSTAGPGPVPVVPRKRPVEMPLTPAASVDGGDGGGRASSMSSVVGTPVPSQSQQEGHSQSQDMGVPTIQEPPKKKRRVALTRVGDLGS